MLAQARRTRRTTSAPASSAAPRKCARSPAAWCAISPAQPFRSFAGLPEGAVLVSEALRPADAALLDPARLAGVATEEGGADGHTAVMLRALGRSGGARRARARPRDPARRPRRRGRVRRHGGAEPLARPASRPRGAPSPPSRASGRRYARFRRLPAVTLDGEAVELQANLELPIELPLVAQSGAHGIGLLRTEFLFMNRESVPDEDTQAETYRTIIEAMGGDPVTIRVLDWGGEKDIEALSSDGHRAGHGGR